jgi:hypothetical protein
MEKWFPKPVHCKATMAAAGRSVVAGALHQELLGSGLWALGFAEAPLNSRKTRKALS